jgi:hypothetical protein
MRLLPVVLVFLGLVLALGGLGVALPETGVDEGLDFFKQVFGLTRRFKGRLLWGHPLGR